MKDLDEDSSPVVIAGGTVPQVEALDALVGYWASTPRMYDLVGAEASGLSHAELLTRTRYLRSRLSAVGLAAMAERSQSAPWSRAVLDSADLATMQLDSGAWTAADDLYLHFLNPKIDDVAFAKVHKYLHLIYPQVFPILDSRVKVAYWPVQKALAAGTGLSGGDNWRRRTWLAIGADVRANRDSGAFAELRSALKTASEAARENGPPRAHTDRLAELSDLRLLDMLTWMAHLKAAKPPAR